jgi:hypothetical protein
MGTGWSRLLFAATFLVCAAAVLLGSRAALTQADSPRTMPSMIPSDIDPNSGFRLPLPKREDLDEAGKKQYDRASAPGASIAGLQGPSGIQLYSPNTAEHTRALNRYLRYEAGFTPRVREIAILTTAREMDSQFEWVAHEPEAGRKASSLPSSTRSSIARAPRPGRNRRHGDRARAGSSRPQGDAGNLRQGQGAVRTRQVASCDADG